MFQSCTPRLDPLAIVAAEHRAVGRLEEELDDDDDDDNDDDDDDDDYSGKFSRQDFSV